MLLSPESGLVRGDPSGYATARHLTSNISPAPTIPGTVTTMTRFAPLHMWKRFLECVQRREIRRQEIRRLTRARLFALTGAWTPEVE